MSVIDHIESAKQGLTGSGLGKAITKATSREVIGPKKKHVDYIIYSLEFENVSIPETADMLLERCNYGSWVVVFKALITTHHLMATANERFMQYIASRSSTWMLQTFLDKSGVQGYDMSQVVRRYSAYLSEKAFSYRAMGYDFCRIARGKENGVLRNADTAKLLTALPAIQQQLDSLLATEITTNDLTNGVITAAFMLLFKDLIRLFACYNDGIINLLETYFEMKKLDCKSALEMYKGFLARIDGVTGFLKIAEDAGIDKGAIPDLSRAPSRLLETLEEHYQSLEKGRPVNPPAKPISLPAFDVSLKEPSADVLSLASSTSVNNKDRKSLDCPEEERRALEKFESQKCELESRKKAELERSKDVSSGVPQPLTLPAKLPRHINSRTQPADSAVATRHRVFSPQPSPLSEAARPLKAKPSDDLLILAGSSSTAFIPLEARPLDLSGQPLGMAGFGGGMSLGTGAAPAFAAPPSFAAAFPACQQLQWRAAQNLMGDVLVPERPSGRPSNASGSGADGRSKAGLSTGLEKVTLSLDDLNVNPSLQKAGVHTYPSRGHQWKPQQPSGKTGGANFQMQALAKSTLPPPAVQPGWGCASVTPVIVPPAGMLGYRSPIPAYGMQPAVGSPTYIAYGQTPAMFRPSIYAGNPGFVARPMAFNQQVQDPFGL